MKETYHVTDGGNVIQFRGVDVGGGSKPKRVVGRSFSGGFEYVALHIPGHKRWESNFQPRVYEPATFMVICITGDGVAEPVLSFPARHRKGE